MKHALALVLAVASMAGARVERLDPRLDRLVPPDAVLEKVADGFTWVEGPLWSPDGGYLLFSDIPANVVRRWRPGNGTGIFLERSGYTGDAPFGGREPGSNGLAFDRDGRLVICQHGDRRVVRIEADGTRTVLADRWEGKRLNSPNDVVVRRDGALWFTDPPFGLPRQFDDPERELPFAGVYRRSARGELALVTTALAAPNGIAFAPDGRTLYLTNAPPAPPAWWAFPVRDDGSVGDGRVLYDAAPWMGAAPGNPDGLKVDRAGNLFGAGPGGVYVIAPDGTLLGRLVTGVATSNVAWGEDGGTLFVTAGTAVYRIRTTTGDR